MIWTRGSKGPETITKGPEKITTKSVMIFNPSQWK